MYLGRAGQQLGEGARLRREVARRIGVVGEERGASGRRRARRHLGRVARELRSGRDRQSGDQRLAPAVTVEITEQVVGCEEPEGRRVHRRWQERVSRAAEVAVVESAVADQQRRRGRFSRARRQLAQKALDRPGVDAPVTVAVVDVLQVDDEGGDSGVAP